MIFFESEVEKLTDKSILNPVKNFDKPNESAHFEVEKNTDRSFSNLSLELIEQILITAVRSCDNTWTSHIVYTFNSLRKVWNFWRVVLDGSAVTKLLPQLYFSQDILRKPKKNGEGKDTEHRKMEQSLDGIILTIIWMVCD